MGRIALDEEDRGAIYDHTVMVRLLAYMAPYWVRVLGTVLLVSVYTGTIVAMPWVIKWAIDGYIATGELARVNVAAAAFLALAWSLVLLTGKDWSLQGLHTEFATGEKQLGQVLLALLLALQALWILAAISIACSTRLGQLSTLLVTFGVFMLGLSSDALFGGPGQEKPLAALAYRLTPNLQFHWLADALSLGSPVSGSYLLLVSGYTILFSGAILCLATALFEGKEAG